MRPARWPQAGIDSARVDAELLAAHAAGVDRGRLPFHEPDEHFYDGYRDLVDASAHAGFRCST